MADQQGAARIGRTLADSTPAFVQHPKPPPDAPNVVLVVLDDLGFGQLGCFGADLSTPNIDRLAAGGLRYHRFHVTALCSPTRACLLTGRNHHAVGMGFLTDIPTGFPGYSGRIPRAAGTLPRVLRDAGYSTYAVGKWHLTPRWEQNPSGPFDRWPLGLGFERYYGFLAGDTNQYAPELVRDNGFVEPPRTPDEGYHLTEDLADQAIRLVRDQRHATPEKPFFLYFATGATHAPHHAPERWIEPYRGQFDVGWDEWRAATFERQLATGVVPEGTTLTERPPWVDAWVSLPAGEQALYARMMEVFGGFLTHTDAQIGRIVGELDASGDLDNTLFLVCSDNGTSAEGGPHGSFNEHRFTHNIVDDPAETLALADELGGHRAYNHYPWGWAWAGNTPFRLWKRYSWLGGVRTPLVVHWPARIADRGAVRSQFAHASDVLPTVLDATGVSFPDEIDGVAQLPVTGASLVPSFLDGEAPEAHTSQYFEMIGSRAMYLDGWKATTDHVGNQLDVERDRMGGAHSFDADRWHLFDLETDFSEAHDVADRHPERLQTMIERWWADAGRYQVLPIDDTFVQRIGALEPPPYGPRRRAELRPGGGPVSEDSLPMLLGGFRLQAELDAPDGGGEGIVCALGDWNSGWALYLLDGCPVVTFNLFGAVYRTATSTPLAAGPRVVEVGYERRGTGGGTVTIAVDGREAARGDVGRDLPFRWQIGGGGLVIGHDRGFPVCDDYRPPFPCRATVRRIVIEQPGEPMRLTEDEVAASLRHE